MVWETGLTGPVGVPAHPPVGLWPAPRGRCTASPYEGVADWWAEGSGRHGSTLAHWSLSPAERLCSWKGGDVGGVVLGLRAP